MESSNSNRPTIEEISIALKEKFGENILAIEQHYDFPVFIFKKESLLEIFHFLYHHPRFAFQYLTTACGLHFPGTPQEFAMMYQVHSLVNNIRLRFKCFTTRDDIQFDSLTPVFSAANWMERETYDFFGFTFKGHPNMKRILNVDDMDYFPMRKEYPVEDKTRYDKDDTMFGREPAGFTKLT